MPEPVARRIQACFWPWCLQSVSHPSLGRCKKAAGSMKLPYELYLLSFSRRSGYWFRPWRIRRHHRYVNQPRAGSATVTEISTIGCRFRHRARLAHLRLILVEIWWARQLKALAARWSLSTAFRGAAALPPKHGGSRVTPQRPWQDVPADAGVSFAAVAVAGFCPVGRMTRSSGRRRCNRLWPHQWWL